jgi:hypothetical protein
MVASQGVGSFLPLIDLRRALGDLRRFLGGFDILATANCLVVFSALFKVRGAVSNNLTPPLIEGSRRAKKAIEMSKT